MPPHAEITAPHRYVASYVAFLVVICTVYANSTAVGRVPLRLDAALEAVAARCPTGAAAEAAETTPGDSDEASAGDWRLGRVALVVSLVAADAASRAAAAATPLPSLTPNGPLFSRWPEASLRVVVSAAAGGSDEIPPLPRSVVAAGDGAGGDASAALGGWLAGPLARAAATRFAPPLDALLAPDEAAATVHVFLLPAWPQGSAPACRVVPSREAAVVCVASSAAASGIVGGDGGENRSGSADDAIVAAVAKLLGVPDLRAPTMAAWAVRRDALACAATGLALKALAAILAGDSGVPTTAGMARLLETGVIAELRGGAAASALRAARRLGSGPGLLPQLHLPPTHQLAVHLPLFLPLLMSVGVAAARLAKSEIAERKARRAKVHVD